MSIDAERLRAGGAYESQAPLQVLIGDLGEIENACRTWKAYRTRVRWFSFLLLVAGALSVATAGGHENRAITLLGGAAFVAGIVGFVHAYKYARGAVSHPERCDIVRQLASTFRDDTHPTSPLVVKMFLRGDSVLLNELQWTQRKKGKQKFYKEAWLTLENEFLDGTRLTASIADLVRVRSYVNSRGKWKVKTRTHHLVTARFAYPASVYGDASSLAGKLQGGIKVPSTASLRGVRVTGGDIKVKATVNVTSDLTKTCAMLSLGVYRMLNLSRRLTAQGRPAQGGAQ